MRTVNIADLKNNLSAHLERVRAGEPYILAKPVGTAAE